MIRMCVGFHLLPKRARSAPEDRAEAAEACSECSDDSDEEL